MDTTDLHPLLERLEGNIDDLEESLAPILKQPFTQTTASLELLDKARFHVMATYAIESILFSYLRLNSVDARAHPVFRELTRVKQYFEKIKAAESAPPGGAAAKRQGTMTLDKGAATRMINHGLAGNDKYDRERAEREAREKAGARAKLEALSEQIASRKQKKRKAAVSDDTSEQQDNETTSSSDSSAEESGSGQGDDTGSGEGGDSVRAEMAVRHKKKPRTNASRMMDIDTEDAPQEEEDNDDDDDDDNVEGEGAADGATKATGAGENGAKKRRNKKKRRRPISTHERADPRGGDSSAAASAHGRGGGESSVPTGPKNHGRGGSQGKAKSSQAPKGAHEAFKALLNRSSAKEASKK